MNGAGSAIDLEAKWFGLVSDILRRHVPDRRVWAFGSRATGRRVKRFSDLDLAVEGRLDLGVSSGLEVEFDESSLPIKVDVVQLGAITPEFRARIEKDFVLVQEASGVYAASSAVAAVGAPDEARA